VTESVVSIQPSQLEPTRISRAEGVARALEEEIVNAGMSAGSRLGTKHEIRERFGVATATVNEALRVLEIRGLVSARPGPGGGLFVTAPTSRVRLNHLVLGFKVGDAPFQDCLAVRNALEPLVIQEAAKHCGRRDATVLRRLISRLAEQLDEPAGFLRVNWDLHRRLARMGTNAPLETLYLTLLDYVEAGLEGVVDDGLFNGQANLEVHRELVEAVIAGEPARVASAIERHTPMADRWAQGLA
jgi:DNA-binding FadR family transcriptional regulator